MHDLDRTLQEFEGEYDAFESYDDEFDADLASILEVDDASETDAVFDEAEEMDLASMLLEIQDDDELEQFLGSLIKKASRAVGKFVRGPVGKALGGVLKNVAKKALPIAGAALGNLVVPGAGGVVGGKLASMAGKMFGLELEGLPLEDQEFEIARRIVRLTGAAAKHAARTPSHTPAVTAAKNAVVKAAKVHAPGLVGALTSTHSPLGNWQHPYGQRTGRWFRRGHRIVLVGI